MGNISNVERERRNILARQARKDGFTARAKALSNADLLDETLNMGGGDGWDGCFTSEGMEEYEIFINELKSRLAEWLK